MRFSTIFAPLLVLVATVVAAPISIRQDDCGEDTTFRFLGSVYCLVPTNNTVTSGPCDPSSQVPLAFDYDANNTALTTVLGHSVNVTKLPAEEYAKYEVTIDGVLRNATGEDYPGDLFGPGITRSYDYPL